ncbi:MAG TPA: 7-cyano-7-deazaguanine synthase [Thermoanaerobaculia bacterium]|nr:7-cyano-7-deazaguanine synthase [Thermoanaerobaculia bacterium]
MTRRSPGPTPPASVVIDVVEPGQRTRRGAQRCEIGVDLKFSTDSLESYFFARWEPVAYDALLVAAAVEFADVTSRRPAFQWRRHLDVRVPVHDPDRWGSPAVSRSLHDALSFLTGDEWAIHFYARKDEEAAPRQSLLTLAPDVEAVIPYSNGLDSRAVAALLSREMRGALVRVRLGLVASNGHVVPHREAFTRVPYRVHAPRGARCESSGRSRGFKFAVVSAIAAFLAGAKTIVVPESGQGALGPALVPVGHAYEDYRSHPLFTRRMEVFVEALFGANVAFTFPRIWMTKGETLREYVTTCADASWASTRSCWQQSRHISVAGKARQCGICAACILRRMSVHAAGLEESREHFVWEDLSAPSFEAGVAKSFDRAKMTERMREYAIAGALHMDHLAALPSSKANAARLRVAAFQLSQAVGLAQAESRARIDRLLSQHAEEWAAFVRSLGPDSFISKWAGSVTQ